MRTYISLLFVFYSFYNIGQTVYKTVSPGLWISASTWQNGNIPPSSLPHGDSIIINNHVTMTQDYEVNGTMIINSNQQVLANSINIYVGKNQVNQGAIINRGIFHVLNLEIKSNGINGSDLFPVVINEHIITAINMTIGNDYQVGKLINHPSGVISITHTTTLEGEINNTGQIDISNLMESHGGYIDGCGRVNVQNIHIEHGTGNSANAPGLFQCADLCYQGHEPNFYIDGVLYKNYQDAFINGDPSHAYFSADSVFICGINFNGEAIGTLPIELTLFGAHQNSKEIFLFWTTATESNNDFFTVEHSENNVNWTLKNTVGGAGNSNTPLHYHLEDKNPNIGWNYYRLKQTDFDGTERTFREVSIFYNPTNGETISVFPNPTSNFIEVYGDNSEHVDFKIIDINGKDFTNNVKILHQGESRLHLNVSALDNGMYLIVTSSNRVKFVKI